MLHSTRQNTYIHARRVPTQYVELPRHVIFLALLCSWVILHIDDFPSPDPALTVLTVAADGFELLDSQVSSLTSYLATDTDTEDRTVSSTDGYEGLRNFTIIEKVLQLCRPSFPALVSKCIITH